MSDNGQQPTDKPTEQPKEQLRHNRDLFGAEQPEVRLPEELATSITADDAVQSLVAANLKDSGAWAALATRLLEADQPVEAYACARTGYHRGLDALRANGWRGTGPVPWDHTPNQGVLRAIGALVVTAHALQEEDEFIRCLNLLHDCDPSATDALGLGHLAS